MPADDGFELADRVFHGAGVDESICPPALWGELFHTISLSYPCSLKGICAVIRPAPGYIPFTPENPQGRKGDHDGRCPFLISSISGMECILDKDNVSESWLSAVASARLVTPRPSSPEFIRDPAVFAASASSPLFFTSRRTDIPCGKNRGPLLSFGANMRAIFLPDAGILDNNDYLHITSPQNNSSD